MGEEPVPVVLTVHCDMIGPTVIMIDFSFKTSSGKLVHLAILWAF